MLEIVESGGLLELLKRRLAAFDEAGEIS